MRIAIKSLILFYCVIVTTMSAKSAFGRRIAELQDVIAGVERKEGFSSPNLYEPLRQLGLAFQEDGRHAESVKTFRQMQHIVHRSLGVYAPEQMESVRLLIRSFVALGAIENAETQQKFLYNVARRSYDPDDRAMHVARWRMANWYRDTGRHDEALNLYAEVRHRLAPTDPGNAEIIKVLRAEAQTLYLAGRCCASEKLARVNELADANARMDLEDKRRIALEYADMLMLERKTGPAERAYGSLAAARKFHAPAKLLGMGAPRRVADAIRRTIFRTSPEARVHQYASRDTGITFSKERKPLPVAIGKPVVICSAMVDNLAVDPDRLPHFYMDVDVTVNESGRPREIDVESNAPARLVRYVKAVLQQSRYRPRIAEAGNLVESNLSFRQTFPLDGSAAASNGLIAWNTVMVSQACGFVLARR